MFWLTFQVSGDITRHPSEVEDNFSQVGVFFRKVLSKPEKERLVDNMGSHLANAQKFIQVRLNGFFYIDRNSSMITIKFDILFKIYKLNILRRERFLSRL